VQCSKAGEVQIQQQLQQLQQQLQTRVCRHGQPAQAAGTGSRHRQPPPEGQPPRLHGVAAELPGQVTLEQVNQPNADRPCLRVTTPPLKVTTPSFKLHSPLPSQPHSCSRRRTCHDWLWVLAPRRRPQHPRLNAARHLPKDAKRDAGGQQVHCTWQEGGQAAKQVGKGSPQGGAVQGCGTGTHPGRQRSGQLLCRLLCCTAGRTMAHRGKRGRGCRNARSTRRCSDSTAAAAREGPRRRRWRRHPGCCRR
jgi:hypothetical protein